MYMYIASVRAKDVLFFQQSSQHNFHVKIFI